MAKILIQGGTVVSSTGASKQDVLIDGETIAALLATDVEIPGIDVEDNVDIAIDATGKYVIPGGVDGHTHMEMPFGGTYAADNFETGTRAAAWGGTTTIVDFAIQSMGATLREGLDAWHAKAEGNCAIDYGFHMIMADVNEGSLKEMEGLVGEGVTSFKLFMAYPGVLYSDDGQVLRALQKGAETGGLILMHAENGIAIDVLIEQALARGQTDPRYHGIVRHELLEAEATHRAIKLAQVANAPVYIVHLSATSALAEVAKARDEGYNAFAETCPQYLFLSTDDLARPDFEGAKYVCSTPLRPKEHQAALWRGLRTDDLSVVSTDHCPFCCQGQKELGLGDFSEIPNGLPSVEHRMDLLHPGVLEGHISRRRWIEIACATPARMFGLYPRKGTIAPGSDADIVIYNRNAKQVFSAATHHMAVDYSCYEGKEITGKVEKVLSRGRLVIDGDKYLGAAGHGQFLRRSTCGYLR